MTSSSRHIVVVVLTALLISCLGRPAAAYGQASVVRKSAKEVIEALSRYCSRTGGRELTQELAEIGGEAAVRRIAQRTIREGGEDALSALVRATRSHGPDALRAADNAVNIPRLLRAVDDLPENMAAHAIRRLAAGADGRVLAQTVQKFGARALRAEVLHPGIGGRLVANLGDDGIALASRASRDQLITISRHADDIAKLQGTQQAGVLNMLHKDLDRMVTFMGGFLEKNPGKSLFTAAATTIILANADKVLGGEGEIVFDQDGKPAFVPKPGMLERIVWEIVWRVLAILLPLIALASACWLGIRLRFYYRLAKLQHCVAEAQLSQVTDQKIKDAVVIDAEECDSIR